MIKILFPIPRQVVVAFSGGVDSVAIVDFLSKNHDVTCAFFHHKTKNSDIAMNFVAKFCTERNLPLLWAMCRGERQRDESTEEYWRRERYDFLKDLGTVITCHHLDDCVETYLWGCMHGTPKVIPAKRDNIIRPFLTTPKSELVGWCERRNIQWCYDDSNDDTKYTRNYIRHQLMPHALHVNPGLRTVVKKIVVDQL